MTVSFVGHSVIASQSDIKEIVKRHVRNITKSSSKITCYLGGYGDFDQICATACRELKEELGADVDVICKLAEVSDYYHLIHRHNINHYFLCKVKRFGERQLTRYEAERFHMSTLRLTCDEAIKMYESGTAIKIGRLVAQRELPVLNYAKKWMGK